MAVWSEVTLSTIENIRLDAEYYQPKYLQAKAYVGNYKLKNYGVVVIHPTEVKRNYSSNGLRIVLAQNNRDNFYNWSENRYMDERIRKSIERNKLSFGDVTVTRSGANFGQTSVITIEPAKNEFFACADLLILKSEQISGCLLSTYLNSKIGRRLMQRGVYGAGQPHIAPSYVKEIPFPTSLLAYAGEIDEIVIKSRKLTALSQSLYTQAQQLLEQELGLDKIKFEKPVGFETSFSEVVSSVRLDAQHFQFKFNQLIAQIKKHSWKHIRDIRSCNRRGVQPIYITNGTIDVVNSQHIGKQHLDYDNLQKTSQTLYQASPEGHILKNDLLIYTTGAYIGLTNVYLKRAPALASNHVNILRLHNDLNPSYMALVMQSNIGKFQTEKYLRGSAQAELYPSDIDKFVVPILPFDKQIQLGDLIRESLEKSNESQQLLNQAKTRVEQLIEEAAGKNE